MSTSKKKKSPSASTSRRRHVLSHGSHTPSKPRRCFLGGRKQEVPRDANGHGLMWTIMRRPPREWHIPLPVTTFRVRRLGTRWGEALCDVVPIVREMLDQEALCALLTDGDVFSAQSRAGDTQKESSKVCMVLSTRKCLRKCRTPPKDCEGNLKSYIHLRQGGQPKTQVDPHC